MQIRLLSEYMGHKAGTVVDWPERKCRALIKDKHAVCVEPDQCEGCECDRKLVKTKPRNKAVGA